MASTEKSRLVHRLASATGLSLVACYDCLRDGREPKNPLVREAWRRVMAEQPGSPPSVEVAPASA